MAHSTFDHLRAPRTHWWLVAASGVVTLICGTVGFVLMESHEVAAGVSPMAGLPGAIYSAVQMLILHTPHVKNPNVWIEIGRWSGVVTVLATTGLLLWKRVCHEYREFSHRSWRGHHVLCGLGDRGYAIARELARSVIAAHTPHQSFRCA